MILQHPEYSEVARRASEVQHLDFPAFFKRRYQRLDCFVADVFSAEFQHCSGKPLPNTLPEPGGLSRGQRHSHDTHPGQETETGDCGLQEQVFQRRPVHVVRHHQAVCLDVAERAGLEVATDRLQRLLALVQRHPPVADLETLQGAEVHGERLEEAEQRLVVYDEGVAAGVTHRVLLHAQVEVAQVGEAAQERQKVGAPQGDSIIHSYLTNKRTPYNQLKIEELGAKEPELPLVVFE